MLSINWVDFIGLFASLSGFVIGLGAVTVIDILGFLGRRSSYWTETTIRAHKVTKPLIWIGICLVAIGSVLFYGEDLSFANAYGIPFAHLCIVLVLILNGMFLSFYVSPYLLRLEREGKSKELLPMVLQWKIAFSFLVSVIGWWGSLILVVAYLLN